MAGGSRHVTATPPLSSSSCCGGFKHGITVPTFFLPFEQRLPFYHHLLKFSPPRDILAPPPFRELLGADVVMVRNRLKKNEANLNFTFLIACKKRNFRYDCCGITGFSASPKQIPLMECRRCVQKQRTIANQIAHCKPSEGNVQNWGQQNHAF